MSSKLADQLRKVFDEAYLPPRGDLGVRIGSAVGPEQPPRRSRTGRFAASLAVGVGTALVIALAIAVPRLIGSATAHRSHPLVAGPAQTPRPSPVGAIVPWIDTPAGPEPTPTPQPTPSSPPAGLQVCRSRDLIAHPGPGGGGLGHYGAPLIFTDRAATPCTLSGFPTSVRFLDAKGRRVTEYRVALVDGGYIPAYANAGVELLPGIASGGPNDPVNGQTYLLLQSDVPICGSAAVATVVVTLGDGGVFRFDTPFGGAQVPGCAPTAQYPVMVSSFQQPGYQPAELTPASNLHVSISVASPGRLGTTLDYTVTLTNVSDQTLYFRPCPGYGESIKGGAGVVVARYLLNCAAVPTLGAGHSRTFAMELPLTTTSAVAGAYELSWLIDGPYIETEVNTPVVVVTG
ncbi:MAG TPA: hypothetical protein VNU19_12015 [Candidatus Acidoferrum sp.]|jgi:hypothetical protein|nr:hypothetical protein [Candidatus Acidoferrum sp.]